MNHVSDKRSDTIQVKTFDQARPLIKQSLDKLTTRFVETHQPTIKHRKD